MYTCTRACICQAHIYVVTSLVHLAFMNIGTPLRAGYCCGTQIYKWKLLFSLSFPVIFLLVSLWINVSKCSFSISFMISHYFICRPWIFHVPTAIVGFCSLVVNHSIHPLIPKRMMVISCNKDSPLEWSAGPLPQSTKPRWPGNRLSKFSSPRLW